MERKDCIKKCRFKKEGDSIYCIAKINGSICGYHLTEGEKKLFADDIKTLNRQQRNRRYYRNKRKAQMNSIPESFPVSIVADMKGCTYSTVKRNLWRFNLVEGFSPLRIINDFKLQRWEPNK